jgi:hypothetical protein
MFNFINIYMKKIVLSIIFLFGVIGNSVAETVCFGDYIFKVIDDPVLSDEYGLKQSPRRYVELTGPGPEAVERADITIPSRFRVDGQKYRVIAIGPAAFSKNRSIERVKIGNGIKKIGGNAFESCYSLSDIRMPRSLKYVESLALAACVSLKSVAFHRRVESIGDRAFEFCKRLESVRLPNRLNDIGEFCFRGCHSLKSINIPSALREIGYCMFRNCKSLETVKLPKGLTAIRPSAFECCISLSAINLKANVDNIGNGAFYRCHNIKEITVSKKNRRYYAEGNCLIDKTGESIILGCQTSVIPEGKSVKYIGSNAFSAINNLRNIVIPSNILEIGDASFYRCYDLEHVILNDGLQKIGSLAFAYCHKLDEPDIPESVTLIEDDAFIWNKRDMPAPEINIIVERDDGTIMNFRHEDDYDPEEQWLEDL